MPILIKLIIDSVCGALNALGGWHILWMRRYLMPVLIGVGCSLSAHIWWLGFLVLPVIGTLCLKYFGGGKFGRGLWLFLQAVVIGLGLFLTGHLAWYFYFPYTVVAGILGGSLFLLFQPVSDAIFGCWLGIIILFIH